MVAENLRKILMELPPETGLVAVSKFHPSSLIEESYRAGQRMFGESRPQELQSKVAELRESCPGIEWHFIGHLQTNKLGMVLPYVSMVQSVDSVHLLSEIDRWACANGKVIDVLLEVHVAAEKTKQGLSEEEVLEVLFDAGRYRGIRFRGLMGMATNTDDELTVDADFERMDSLMAYVCDLFPELEDFNQLSIGMSGDYRIALRHGATMVRIGSAIFGERS